MSSRTFDHLFVRLPNLCLDFFMLCTRLCTHFSAVHSVVIVFVGDICRLFKLLLKFRNVLKHTESRISYACNQNRKQGIPTALEVFPCFETRRKETWTDPSRKHLRNARVISPEELPCIRRLSPQCTRQSNFFSVLCKYYVSCVPKWHSLFSSKKWYTK